MILDKTYFSKRPIKVPQSESLGNGVSSKISTSDAAIIDECINLYEPKFLINLLGYDVANEFIEAYKASILTENPIDLEPKWVALKNKLYNITEKTSPAANYVFFFICDEIIQTTTRVGSAVGKLEETQVVSFIQKQATAWNLMTENLFCFYKWLESVQSDYEHDDVKLSPKLDENGKYILLKNVNIYGI